MLIRQNLINIYDTKMAFDKKDQAEMRGLAKKRKLEESEEESTDMNVDLKVKIKCSNCGEITDIEMRSLEYE